MADPDQRPPANHRRLATALRDQVAVRRTIGDQVISLAHLRGRPVRDDAGTRVGRVSDIVVRQISVRGRKAMKASGRPTRQGRDAPKTNADQHSGHRTP